MIPSRTQDLILLVLSKLKQADYASLVSDANLQAGKRWAPTAPPFVHPQLAFENTMDLDGKGHDYMTQQWATERALSDTLALIADPWLLGLFFSFALGSVSSVQPNAGGNPTAWMHTIKPMDPSAVGNDLPLMTVYREWANAANAKGRIHSCAVPSVSVEFPASAALRMSAQITGSGQETTGALAAPPALASIINLMGNDTQFFRGAQGAPTDITSRLVRGSVRFSAGWGLDQENARAYGGGLYASRAWTERPQFALEWQEFVDHTDVAVHDTYLAQTIEELKVLVNGAVIGAGPEVYSLEVRALAAKVKMSEKGKSGTKTIYNCRAGIEDLLKEGANDVFTVKVQNTETSYLT